MIENINFIKNKNCSLKGTIKRMKRQSTEQEKIIVIHLTKDSHQGYIKNYKSVKKDGEHSGKMDKIIEQEFHNKGYPNGQ